jgi:hypothetical protein
VNLQATVPLDEAPAPAADDAMARLLEARIRDEAELIDALRARQHQIGLSDAGLEHAAGLAAGHVSKLLAPARRRSPTLATVDRLMSVLALSIVLVHDPSKMRGRPLPRRDDTQVRMRAISRSAIAAARPHVFDELMRRASTRRWARVDARQFMSAMMEMER